MSQFHCRTHEFGPSKPRIRIWTEEMISYGQFNVVSFDDVDQMKKIFDKIGLGQLTFHRCDGKDCICNPMTSGQEIKDYI